MNSTTYSPSVLLIDDDKPFLEYLRENFHNKTATGVLVAPDLISAREILDRGDVSIDAIVCDLYFDVGRDDPHAGLNDGVDILAYAQIRRPEIVRYIMSYYAKRSDYEGKLKSRSVPVSRRFEKKLFQEADDMQSPWSVVERDLIKLRLKGDPALSQLTDEAVTEFARSIQWPVQTFIQDLILREHPTDMPRFGLHREIRVICKRDKDEDGNVRVTANAFELGLLTPGYGLNIEEALDALKETIISQKSDFQSEDPEKLRGYAKSVKERLDTLVTSEINAL